MSAPLRGGAVIAHGGGPTPVINASLAGVITEAHRHSGVITALWGARFGATGMLEDRYVDLFAQDAETVEGIRFAPGSALGSSRRAIRPEDFDRVLQLLRARQVRYLFYTGGNGSMGTALDFERYARAHDWDMRVIGIPKTIDNDLHETDHTPGYASCGRFFAHAVRDIGEDNRSLPSPITVVEVLGRNVGWVAAATALARRYDHDAPHLIYFPEVGISADQLASDVERVYRRLGRCVVVACEGQTDDMGGWFGAELNTMPGVRDPLPGNMGHVLAKLIWGRLGVRARSEKPGLFGRSCAALASEVDREESFRCGEAAVRAAVSGASGQMVAIRRVPDSGAYASEMRLAPLEAVAGRERPLPREWINAEANDVAREFLDYAAPLVGRVDAHTRLKGAE